MNPDEQQHGSVDSPLCQRCKTIDLQDFFSGASAGTDRIFHVFKPPHHLQLPGCSLCCAIAFIRPDLSENHVYHLVQAQTDSKLSGNCLTVWQPGHSKAQIWTPYYAGPRFSGENTSSLPGSLSLTSDQHPCENLTLNVPGIINFDVVKDWMNRCKKRHGKPCKLESRTSNIPNLQLIDCATKQIGPFQEGDIYAALSYCWGASQPSQADEMGTPFKLPQHLPATIEDAILATQKLGIKYIWIDRYCVPQGAEDPGRHEQISLMHKIYSGAEVTLIAAAGDSPTYGLPGVTKERRKPPVVRLGSHTLVATLTDPLILIASSIWSTRGWTYQEGLLSRRRLVFTDQQVYFQCKIYNPSHTYLPNIYYGRSEALSLPFESIASLNIPKDVYMDGFFKSEPTPWEIWPRINEYTRRSLSYQEDIMNAMLGVLERYVESKLHGHHFWHVFGMPGFYKDVWGDDPNILWQESFLLALTWELRAPSKRREGFPSWSWVGWKGTGFVGPYDCLSPRILSKECDLADIHVEQDDGTPAADIGLIVRKGINTAPHWKIPRIIFECLSVSLHIKKLSQRYSASYRREFPPPVNQLNLGVVMQSGEILRTYNFQLLPRDLAEDPGLEKGIPCVGLLLNPRKRPDAELSSEPKTPTYGDVVVLLVMESHRRTGTEKTGKLYERIGKTLIPNKHLAGVSDKRGFFTVG